MKTTKHFIRDIIVTRKVVKTAKSKKCNPCSIILMSTVLPIHQVTGTIDFTDKIAERKERAAELLAACTGNTWVTITPTVITAVGRTVTNYNNALPSNRPAMFKTMNNSIQTNLLNPFQAAANADPANSITILESGKFNVKGQSIPQKHHFAGEAGVLPGTADLVAEGGPPADHLHIWFSSLDGVVYKMEIPTNAANTHLTGYPSSKYVFFMHQLSIKDVLQEMSGVIKVLIK